MFAAGYALGVATLYALLFWSGALRPPDAPPPRHRPGPPPLSTLGPSADGRGPRALGDSADGVDDSNPFARPPSLFTSPAPDLDDFRRLRTRQLAFPVQGYDLRRLRDNFAELRGSRVHEAIDILAPRGTPVLAVDDGPVKKLFQSARGGLTVYQFDAAEAFCYYYAHLDRYAEGLQEGQMLRKGQRVGYVGTTGNAPPDTPHLHFTIFKLGPEKQWWEGLAVNPYPLWALAP